MLDTEIEIGSIFPETGDKEIAFSEALLPPKPSHGNKSKLLPLAVFFLALMVLPAALILTQTRQDLRKMAMDTPANNCTAVSPANLTCLISDNKLVLTWDGNEAEKFAVRVDDLSNPWFTQNSTDLIADSPTSSYTVSGASNDLSYKAWVHSYGLNDCLSQPPAIINCTAEPLN